MRINEVQLPKKILLAEANIVNQDDIDAFCERLADLCTTVVAKEWMRDKVNRFIRRNDALHVMMTDQNRPRTLPDWAQQQLQANPEAQLDVFVPSHQLQSSLEHVADYLNSLVGEAEMWTQLPAMSVERVLKLADRWVQDAIRKNRNNEADEGVKTVLEVGSMRWITTTNMEVVKRDGAILRNCLAQGMYGDKIVSGRNTVYILRDANNQPHVALMVDEGPPAQVREIKGKNNRPPVGRYIAASQQVLNALKIPGSSSGHSDVFAMGLFWDPKQKHYGTASELSELIMQDVGDGYSAYSMPTRAGVDYYIAKDKGHHIAKLTLGPDGKILLDRFPPESAALVKKLVGNFLNNGFDGPAPPPQDPGYSHAAGRHMQNPNFLASLGLHYDHHTRKYYDEPEHQPFYESDMFGGYKAVAWGTHEYITEIIISNAAGAPIAELKIGQGTLRKVDLPLVGPPGADNPKQTHDHSDENWAKMAPLLRDFLNNAFQRAPAPDGDIYGSSSWRRDTGTYYDAARGKYGSFLEVSTPIYRFKDGVSVRKWKETGTTYYTFLRGKKPLDGYQLVLGQYGFKLHDRSEDRRGEVKKKLNERDKADLRERLVELLNAVAEFKTMDFSDATYDFRHMNIWKNDDGEWGAAEDVAKPVMQLMGGHRFDCVLAGHGKHRIMLRNGSGPTISEFVADGYVGGEEAFTPSHFKHHIPAEAGRSGRRFRELFEKHNVDGVEPPKSDEWRDDYPADHAGGHLFKLGLFNKDGRWLMLQDGKAVYKGEGFKVVNFRNRVLFVLDDDTIAGEGTKDPKMQRGGSAGIVLTKMMAYGPWMTYRDLLKIVSKAHGAFTVPMTQAQGRDSDDHHQKLGQYGFTFDKERRLRDVEELHPPESIIRLPDGSEWQRTAYAPQYMDQTKGHHVEGQRYTLLDKTGKDVMFATFDDKGYFVGVKYGHQAEHTRRYDIERDGRYYMTTSTSLDRKTMPKPLIQAFGALLEKQGLKLTATQYRAIGLYRDNKGKVRSLTDDPLLKQYLAGEITFKDGYSFKKEYEHNNEWLLLRPKAPDDDDDHSYTRRVIEVKLDNDGIESIKPISKEAKRSFHKYKKYLLTLIQVFAKVAGDNAEDDD